MHSLYWCRHILIPCYMGDWVRSNQFSCFFNSSLLLTRGEQLSLFLESIYINILNENIGWLLKHVPFIFLFGWLVQETCFLLSWSQHICLITKFFWNIVSYLRWYLYFRFMWGWVLQRVHAWICMIYVDVLSECFAFFVKTYFLLFSI